MNVKHEMDHTASMEGMTPDVRRRIVRWLFDQINHVGGNTQTNWRYLQAAHVAGQTRFALHVFVHLQMLRQSWRDGDPEEGLGQLLRLALVPLGHMTGRLPLGNSGRSDVSAFTPMAVQPEIAELLLKAQRHTLKS